MYKTTFIPDSTNVKIDFPVSYIGKKINVLFYTDDEINQDTNTVELQKTNKKQNLDLKSHKKSIKISPLVELLTGVIPNEKVKNDDYYAYLIKKHSMSFS